MANPHRITKASRRLATYTRVRDLEDVLNTFEARARKQMALIEDRILRRRREAIEESDQHADPLARFGSRKPSLNEYEGHD